MYLNKLNEVAYYKSACKRLIMLRHRVPHYVAESFRRLNPNALLHIYVELGCWHEAVELIRDYVHQLLVRGASSLLDVRDSLSTGKPTSVVFPYALVDNLLIALSKSISCGGGGGSADQQLINVSACIFVFVFVRIDVCMTCDDNKQNKINEELKEIVADYLDQVKTASQSVAASSAQRATQAPSARLITMQ